MRAMVTSVGLAGHAFPILALARSLQAHGHEVLVETSQRWCEAVAGIGARFIAAQEDIIPPGRDGDDGPTLADAVRLLEPTLREFRPDVVVSDLFTLAPALAAEAAGVPRATLIPHVYPPDAGGLPLFGFGLRTPRTVVGRALWRTGKRPLETGLRRGRTELNRARAHLGLAPVERFHGAISKGLAMVATFPQLEYPRRWPAHVRVTGPMFFELPYPDIELPEGDAPLVLVAPTTSQDREHSLVRVALEALADEPVRVVVTTNREEETAAPSMAVPANAVVVNWLSYAQVMPRTSLAVCSGGHGTVVRALADGVPLLICPAGADQPENGARVTWTGAGLMLPGRLLRPGPLRWAARPVLHDRRFAERARRIAAWARDNDGASRGVELVEQFVGD